MTARYIASCLFTARFPQVSARILSFLAEKHPEVEQVRCCIPPLEAARKYRPDQRPSGQSNLGRSAAKRRPVERRRLCLFVVPQLHQHHRRATS